VDIATHALASYALARGFFPRRRWPVVVGMLIAGTIADIDLLSSFIGPAAFFATRRTYTHSLLGTLVLIVLAVLLARCLARKQPESIPTLLLPLAAAALFHLVLDLFQDEGVALLWPFRPNRFATDWLPPIDPWILAILIAGILLPELVRLVTSEIGVKHKAPRGRNGAIVALSFIVLYIGARALLHSGSVASLEPHSYHGESARSVGSFPDAISIFAWHGVVETRSLLCLADVPTGMGETFDPESAECSPKPDPSPALDAAQRTRVASEYLPAVPFPRAIVAKTEDGYEVVLRSMRDLAEGQVRHRIVARIRLDSRLAISDQQLIWARDVHLH
jgi:membrane-bound metal-dependent hydrolase YbcI (DUF457 family)